ncbi:MAG TPA: hypothetical protein DCX22_01925 [Dehalococcoidia bacterium]|nr:hypothetical protein [Dehalococcoidia bacterium]
MLRERILTSIIGLPLVIAAVWFGTPWFSILIAAATIFGIIEFYRLANLANSKPFIAIGIVWSVLLLLTPYCPDAHCTSVVMTGGIALSLVWLLGKASDSMAFSNWAWTVGGVVYIGWMATYWILLRNLESGMLWTFWTLFTIFASDIGAFFIGRKWGKHALARVISPKKTWEGAFGGLFSSIVISIVFGIAFSLPLSWWQLGLFGIGINLLAQIGDLIESLLKRNTHVKNASNLLPGHGGILDRLDSLLLNGAFVYYIIFFFIK